MSGRIEMLKNILDEVENGFIILKMIFQNRIFPEDFTITEVNVPFEGMTGIPMFECVGMNYSDKQQDLNFLGFDWLEEYCTLAVDQKFRNREKYMESPGVYLRIRTFIPRPGYLVIILSDITTVRRLELENGSNEQRFRSLVENCKDGYLFFSTDGRVTSSSANIRELLGFSEDELKQSPGLEFLNHEDRQKVKEGIHYVLVHPRIASELEFCLIQKDRPRLWFEGTFHNMLQVKGVNSVVLKIKEINRRKTEELQVYQMASWFIRNYPI